MVGAVYASNTVGAILGSLGFSLYIIPHFGTRWAQQALILIAAASAIIALIILRYGTAPRRRRKRQGLPGLLFRTCSIRLPHS